MYDTVYGFCMYCRDILNGYNVFIRGITDYERIYREHECLPCRGCKVKHVAKTNDIVFCMVLCRAHFRNRVDTVAICLIRKGVPRGVRRMIIKMFI